MATTTEKRTSKMILDGSQPARTIKDLAADIRILNNHIKKLDTTSEEFDKAAGKMRHLKKEISEANAQMRLQRQATDKAGISYAKYFRQVVAGVAAGNVVTNLFLKAVDAIPELISRNAKLSDSYADIQKTTGLALSEVHKIDAYFKDFDTRTPRAELRGLAVEAGRLGIEGADNIVKFVRTADKIKVALGDDLGGSAEENIRIVGKLTEQYSVMEREGVDLEKALLKTGSAINELSASGSAQAEYLVNFTRRVAGSADAADIAIEKMLAYAATLDEAGQNVEVSGTTIQKVLTKMYTDTEEFAAIAGVSVQNFNAILEKDSEQALRLFLKGLQGNEEGLRELATRLEDAELTGTRAMQVLASLANNTGKLEEKLRISSKAMAEGISLTEEFEKKNNNFAGTGQKLGKKMNELWVNSYLRSGIISLVNWVGELNGIHQRMSDTLRDNQSGMNAMIEVAKKLNVEDERRVDLIKEINLKYGDYLDFLLDEKASVEDLTVAQTQANAALEKRIELKAKEEVLSEAYTKLLKAQTGMIKDQTRLEQLKQQRDPTTNKALPHIEGDIKAQEKLIEAWQKKVDKLKASYDNLFKSIGGDVGKKNSRSTQKDLFLGFDLDQLAADTMLATTNAAKEASEKAKRAYEQGVARAKKFLETLDDLRDKFDDSQLSKDDRELVQAQRKYDEKLEKLRLFYEDGFLTDDEYHLRKMELEALRNDELVALTEQQNEEWRNRRFELQDEMYLLTLTDHEREIELIQRHYEQLIQEAEQYGLDVTALEKAKNDAISKENQRHQAEIEAKEAAHFEAMRDIRRDFYNSLLEFMEVMSQEQGALGEFARGMAFFQIAISQAEAMAKALANTQSPTPDNIATGGLSGLTKFAIISAGILKVASAARSLLFPPPDAPSIQRLATGGQILQGPLHSSGGMPVYNPNTGMKVMELEGGEAVLSRATVHQNPEVVKQLLASSMYFGGKNITQIPSFNFSRIQQAAIPIMETGGVVSPTQNVQPATNMVPYLQRIDASIGMLLTYFQENPIPKEIYGKFVFDEFERDVTDHRRRVNKNNLAPGNDGKDQFRRV